MASHSDEKLTPLNAFRERIYTIIYGVNSPAGKAFDVVLLILILLSVLTIMFETVEGVDQLYHRELIILEWCFSILFTLEYAMRIFVSKKPLKYIFSFYGIIDLLSILPVFLSLVVTGSHILSNFRILRLLRLFRVLRLMKFMQESSKLKVALLASRAKIMVFLYSVLIIAVLIGTLIYFIEGPENGFASIPKCVYFTLVTLTTVGYGDMVPVTPLGQFLSSFLMVIGYGIIAVPTGIVGVEIARDSLIRSAGGTGQTEVRHTRLNGIVCAHCNREGHRDDADYCYNCGHNLNA